MSPVRGFSLVELLVVIGIIALLIGILLPSLSRARAQANRVACLSNIKQLHLGIMMYCNDNDGWFPTCAFAADGLSYVPRDEDWIWWQANRNLDDSAIAKYVGATGDKLQRVFRCPADSFEGRTAFSWISPGQGPYLYSYNMNLALGGNFKQGAQLGRSKSNQWRSPTKKIMLTEIIETASHSASWNYADQLTHRHGSVHRVPSQALPFSVGVMGANVSAVFLDGHAEGVDEAFACDIYQIQPDTP